MANVSSSNSQKALVPKLRFPGFEGEWQSVALSEFAERIMRKNSKNESDLPLTISSKDGLVDQISYFNKTVASKDMSGYYLLLNGEFAYNKSYSVGYDFGSIKRLDRYPMGTLSTLYICFALKKYDSDFMKTYFDSLKWYREIYMIAAEGARNHGLLNVPTEDFFATKHTLPESLDEQKHIAAFFGALERRIQAQQRLVDALKSYKRGAFIHIYKKEIQGSREVTLGSIVICHDSKRIPVNAQARLEREGVYPYYGANGIQGYIDDYIFDGDYILLAEDGGHFDEFTTRSIAQFISGKSWVNNHAHILEAIGCDSKYLFYILEHMDIRSYINGTSRAKLNQEDMLTIRIPLPPADAQKRFTDILETIDKQIDVQQRGLVSIEKLQNGLLSALFI